MERLLLTGVAGITTNDPRLYLPAGLSAAPISR
jgi:hypothetical protein